MTPAPRIDFNLYLITDRKQTRGRDLRQVVEEALRGGVRSVQLREKDMSARELYELAYDLRKLTSSYGAKLFINDRVDIAQAVNADGVHLGGESLPVYRVRKLLGDQKLIGVSCHNQVSAVSAQEKGADFITFGPVYHTPSKASYGPPVGVEKLSKVAGPLRIPVFALGGIKGDRLPEVLQAGAFGVGVISAIIAEDNPERAAAALLEALPRITTPQP